MAALRWTIHKAAVEFGLSRETLEKNLRKAGIDAQKDYSTKDIVNAIYGDFEQERIGKIREEKEKLIRERLVDEGNLVASEEVNQWIDKTMSAIKSVVMASSLLPEEKSDLLKVMQSAVLK